ncbi:unnamed protein product [Acanthosepion pharaonis]|uniref:Uncharacterized protein n=1 Tax=Acanthosepion pharaonis TaxID=158019 RepID=A0A812B862_ACAPH|nr:unnamed protein product [Sepia pharaonis]
MILRFTFVFLLFVSSLNCKHGFYCSREKRQAWQSQMSDVDFQLSLLAKYAGIEFHPQVLEIILDLIRMNVSIPMLAKMIKLMCAQKAQVQTPNSVNSQNGNSKEGIPSIPSLDLSRTLIVTSSAYSSESNTASCSNPSTSNRNTDSTPDRPALNTRNHVTTRPTRTRTASRVLKK